MSPRYVSGDDLPRRGSRFSHSLEVGLLIMRSFAGGSTQGIADTSTQTKVSRSTVHRYTATLAALGMLEQDSLSRRYRLGMLPVDIGTAALQADRTVTALHDDLQALRHLTGCTVRMGVLIDTEALIIAYAPSFAAGQALTGLQLRQGARAPAHCTALGKVLLGALEPKELRQLLATATLTAYTPQTITDKRATAAQASQAWQQGVAIETEEHTDGVVGVAVPVIDQEGSQAAALSLIAHTPEVTIKDLEGHLDALAETASAIGNRIEPAPLTLRPSL